MNPTCVRIAALALITGLAGCSVLETDKIDYKSAGKAPTLEVPPDLTQLSRENRYAIPGGAVSANAYEAGRASAPGIPTAVAQLGDVRMERSGNQRWVVVNRPPEEVWDAVRDFWLESGFLLTSEQRNLGILETDWAENRAKLPQDVIRSTLGKLIDSVYSTGELDRFRTRLERSGNGTEIYITHRGMVEVYTSQRQDNTTWQPRPVDPELETEFLRRLMVKLGVSQEQSKQAAATAAAAPQRTATISNAGGQPVVQISEGFDRAWRRVGLALDRTGFTVEDRDRSAGLYYVRYVAPNPERETGKPGVFGRLFGGSKKEDNSPQKYRVQVKSQGESTTVSVLGESGGAVPAATAQRIVQVIADDLR
ncbi:outer membrane protein assembly factor BamC [Xenophilus arseniciresistens]|uniref:Outer membrane protein assembly factor BamC n=1 Tax=Xenophilus arseniciresistens TaxID=1283306 RepID=A0AAE3N9J7_9BURK|nr:outer membrane protein assembly factor BamC [Xenophilus arseniciresistens]MDA7415709.1 outer membrane protein assembly factor BamC [Xenophilus arseniciresistens]